MRITSTTARTLAGITLLEVLISMGILTIGLVSVAALVPAGRSQAVRAVIYDRSSTLAANAAADLINRGFLRTEELIPATAGTFLRPLLIYDPVWAAPWGPIDCFVTLRDNASTVASSTTQLAVAPLGTGGGPGTGVAPAVADILFRSEDDPIYEVPSGDADAPPLPGWTTAGGSNGRRAFDGTYSYLATLQTGEFNPPFWLSGRQATLTIVAFHRRDPSTPPFSLAPNSGVWVDPDPTNAPIQLPDGDTIRDVIKPGSMVLWVNHPTAPTLSRWHRVLLVADQSTAAAGLRVGISCEGSDPPTGANDRLYILPGSVGGLQVPVILEGSSQWSE